MARLEVDERERIRQEREINGDTSDEPIAPDMRPCKWFDLIVGTSTGGLIAIMLGRLKMTVPQTIEAYTSLSEKVFSDPSRLRLATTGAAYSAKNLVKYIDQLATEKGVEMLADMDPAKDKCHVVVLAKFGRSANERPKLFRSYDTGDDLADQVRLADVGRATTAAPTVFKRAEIKLDPANRSKASFVDGGLGYNNPAEEAFGEFRRIWPNEREYCIISIGAGKSPAAAINSGSIWVHERMTERQWHIMGDPSGQVYVRLNVIDTRLNAINLADHQRVDDIEELTQTHINKPEYKELRRTAIQGLMQAKGRLATIAISAGQFRYDPRNYDKGDCEGMLFMYQEEVDAIGYPPGLRIETDSQIRPAVLVRHLREGVPRGRYEVVWTMWFWTHAESADVPYTTNRRRLAPFRSGDNNNEPPVICSPARTLVLAAGKPRPEFLDRDPIPASTNRDETISFAKELLYDVEGSKEIDSDDIADNNGWAEFKGKDTLVVDAEGKVGFVLSFPWRTQPPDRLWRGGWSFGGVTLRRL